MDQGHFHEFCSNMLAPKPQEVTHIQNAKVTHCILADFLVFFCFFFHQRSQGLFYTLARSNQIMADDQEGSFERIVLPNERESAPGAFHHSIAQSECYVYSSEYDDPTEGIFRSCIKFYRQFHHKAEVLFAMTIGFMDYEGMIAQPPFSQVKKKSSLQVQPLVLFSRRYAAAVTSF